MASSETGASHLGIRDERDFGLLADALAITSTYRPLIDGLRWPGPKGSEVDRLDQRVAGTITVTDTLVASQRTARASALHLATLLQDGAAPRASVAVTLSRAALLGSVRIIYILGPTDPETRVRHAQRVIRAQAESQLRAIRTFSQFGSLKGLQAPGDLVDALEEVRKELPKESVTDTAMIASTASIIGDWLTARGADQPPVALEDHLPWMWNAWSGIAHGWAWPKYLPGNEDPDRDVAPGSWILDFKALALIVHLALKLLADAFESRGAEVDDSDMSGT